MKKGRNIWFVKTLIKGGELEVFLQVSIVGGVEYSWLVAVWVLDKFCFSILLSGKTILIKNIILFFKKYFGYKLIKTVKK